MNVYHEYTMTGTKISFCCEAARGYTSHPAKSEQLVNLQLDSQRRSGNDGEFDSGLPTLA